MSGNAECLINPKTRLIHLVPWLRRQNGSPEGFKRTDWIQYSIQVAIRSEIQPPLTLTSAMHSIFDLFKVGVGPSSSHTVGPMIAANTFAKQIVETSNSKSKDSTIERLVVQLYGSLALTGKGHATDHAVLAGLSGLHPATVDPIRLQQIIDEIDSSNALMLNGSLRVAFNEEHDLVFLYNESLPFHPNGMTFTALDLNGEAILVKTYYSVGGGFVVSDDEAEALSSKADKSISSSSQVSNSEVSEVPVPFTNAAELLAACDRLGLNIEEAIQQNELIRRSEQEISQGLDLLWDVMRQCIESGCQNEGILPGGLNVRRRAPEIHRRLEQLAIANRTDSALQDPLLQLDWVSLFALAVNEENAAGGRVVTAPTNGAAGIIPAVLAYYDRFYPGASREGRHRFLRTAGAIGLLYKRNASLSAAEMGCQGEVGVACSMAAAGLAAVMGGSNRQIENAAEIGMEHNLGLTCDPIRGLVQVPCIERNTMGAAKAINAARLAVLYGDGTHKVPLDKVIETMRQTGVDMQSKYKETSLGGLAVNVVNC